MRYIEVDMLRKKRVKKVYKQVVDETTNQVKMVSHYEPLPERDYRSEGKKLFEQSKKVPRKKETQS